ncbi:MAG TPA: hypothetical protein VFN41_13975 [Candidatus Limnocylindrales bacterium]|nr:hypothetical protein [Candidatus Limnocylindrales bacterium]
MGDAGTPVGGEDQASAAVRLLRSVAPWTAPNSTAPGATSPAQPSAPVPAEWGTARATTDPARVDRSINGPGITTTRVIVFLVVLWIGAANGLEFGRADGPVGVGWGTVLLALIGVSLAWMWMRRRAAKRRLRQGGMRAGAVVSSVTAPLGPGIIGQGVRYRYDVKGRRRHGHATLGRRDRPLKPGDHIAILYDLADPDVNIME